MGGLTGDGSIRMDGSPSTFLYRAARPVPGLLLCACIALPANELSKYHPSLDALASIGLTVDFDSIRTKGPRPLFIGLFGWLAVSGLLLLMTIHFF